MCFSVFGCAESGVKKKRKARKKCAKRRKAALRFEKAHSRTIRNFNFQRGDLVLMRNTAIEKSLNRKMRPRYLGPLVIVSRNKGGAYIICELDGTVFDRPIAAFRIIPYHARKSIALPDIALDISTAHLREMEESNITGADDSEDTIDDEHNEVADIVDEETDEEDTM